MRKPTYTHYWTFVLVLLLSLSTFAQDFVPFTPRFNQTVRGDIVLIGNNILGPDNNAFNNDDTFNDDVDMRYIDIDSLNAQTFSSSSADLSIPNPNCFEIIHAGLYWSAVSAGTAPIDQVLLRGPSGDYNSVTGTVIFDALSTDPNVGNNGGSVDGGDSFPYACYADITNVIRGLTNTIGTYTVANVSSAEGRTSDFNNGTGHSAGWSLFIVYEDPTVTGRLITSFDGFSAMSAFLNPVLDVPVSGFQTIPIGPVRANFAFAALEGDSPIRGDQLRINGVNLSAPDRPGTPGPFPPPFENLFANFNFFNSTISQPGGLPFNDRNPNSTNTLGFDTGIIEIPNPNNSVIGNGDTSATVRLQTTGDTYFPYFYALSVDIIEPNIVLTKLVEDPAGTDIEGDLVDLGDELNYIIGFQNVGNDNATNFTIRDVLPVNVEFDVNNDIEFLPPGVTIQSYNVATRELIFAIEDTMVEAGDAVQSIRFRVRVVSDCSLLTDVCSNVVENQAFSTYQGTVNTNFTISDDPSFNTNTGCLLIPSSTNFLANLDCTFTEDVVLCGDSTVLTAANGYDSYSWSTSPTGTPVIATTQSITVNNTGQFFSFNTAMAPCQSITQTYNVTLFGSDDTDPILPFADQIVICPDDGEELSNIFLCGTNDSRFFQTNITDASSIIWELLDETSCDAVLNSNCANTSPTCTWNQVETGPNFLVDTAGQYRLTLNYPGGCFNRFFFNVFQNQLTPTVDATDIICTTPGEIIVGSVPNDYEYSIDGTNYQNSNVFSVSVPGVYTVTARQINVSPNPCIFTVPNVQIRERNVTLDISTTQPLCSDDLGEVRVTLADAEAQYTFSIAQGSTVINTVGPIIANNFTFENLAGGTYTITATSEDGCLETEDVTITVPDPLVASSALTTPLTCTTGELTITATGGTEPYFYFVNNAATFQNSPIVGIPTAGTYTIRVVDFNNCEVETTIDVEAVEAPTFVVDAENILCADAPNSGSITVTVSDTNGNTLQYGISSNGNDPVFQTSPIFTNLPEDDYDIVVQYTIGTQPPCFTNPREVPITTVAQLTADVALTTPYSCLGNGEITVSNIQNGTPPYMYSIDGINFQTGTIFSDLIDGVYTVTVRDDNSCSITETINIAPLDPPTDLEFTNTALTCPTLTTEVTLTTTGGRAPLEYRITAPAAAATSFQSAATFTGLDPEVYTFEVRDADNCTYSEAYAVEPLPTVTVTGEPVNEISCFGETDGRVLFTVSETSNFNYTVSLGTTTIDSGSITGPAPNVINVSNLAEGTYDILITDAVTNCTATASATIAPAPSELTATNTPTPLTCVTDGTVTITASGGSGGYRFELVQPDATVLPFQSGNTFTGLTQAGSYTVNVEDVNGCDVTTTFTLTTPVNPTATLDATTDVCLDPVNGATIVVTASDGTPPYEYSLNGGAFDSSNTFTNLAPNTYNIVVRDVFGCQTTTPLTLTIAPQLTAAPQITKGLDCTTTPDAEITVTITGGTSPFTYDVNIGGAGFAGPPAPVAVSGNTFVFTAAAADTYQFLITDANNCTVESSAVTITPVVNPTAEAFPVPPLCNGDATGSVEIVPSEGTAPYTIVFDGGAPSSVFTYTGLVAGNYPYTITDANSCTFSNSVTLTEPTAISATATPVPFSCSTSNTNQSGSVTVNTPSGGTAPYQFSFNGSNFTSTNVLTVNDNGADQIITWEVRDANGCTVSGSETLSRLNPPAITSITNAPPVTCTTTTSDVTVSVTPGTGIGTLTYEITTPSGAVTSNTTGVFTGLVPDTYVFRVTDTTGCFVTESYTVPPVTPIAITGTVLSNVGCRGESTGAIRYTVTGVSGGGYTISNFTGGGSTLQSGNTIDITGLPAGTYTLEVTDNSTNCTAEVTITITEPATTLSATATATTVFCTTDDSQITVTATGGTPNYRYAVVIAGAAAPAPASFVNTNVLTVDTNSGADLNWDVYVADANNCPFTVPVTIISNGTPTVTTPPLASNQCTATTAYTFTASGSGGLAPLEYSINGGVSFQSSPTFTVNAAASYTVTVRDANGCTATSTTTTDVFEPLNANAVLTKDLTCSVPTDATIDITTFGGSNDFTIEQSIDGAAFTTLTSTFTGGTFMVTTGTDGDYQFRITDNATSCSVLTNVVTVTPTVPVTASEVHVDPTCNGFNDGSITLTPTGGEAPFEYSINGGTFVASNVFGGLVAATYTFVVRDARGCQANLVVTLDNPPPLDVTLTSTGIVCNVNTLGSFTATINSGGVADFVYTLFDSSFNQLATSGTTSATSHTFPGLTFGDYYISIVDANGCEYNSGIQRIDTPPIIGLTNTVDSNSCTTGVDILVTATGGVAPYRFSIFGQPGTASPPQAINTFTYVGLLHNTRYFLQVQDVNNCISVIEVTTPAAPSTIQITGTTPSNVSCNGEATGELEFTVENYDPTVTDINFEILDGLSLNPVVPAINGTLSGAAGGPVTTTLNTIPAGSYVLQVREATGTECPASFAFIITQPIQPITAMVTANVPANCNADAQVTVTATGGTPPYRYAADTSAGFPAATATFSTSNVLELDPVTGTNWEILVEDANGCTFRLPVTITETADPTIDPIAQQCYTGTSFNITLSGTVVSGIPEYSIGGAFQTSPTFTINGPGSYDATIRDTNGCTAQTTFVVAPQVFLAATLTQDLTCVVNASITLTPTGGTGTYQPFEVSFNGGAFGPATSPFTTAVAGDYQFRVFDNQATPTSGCPALSDVITVTPNTTPTLTETHVDVTCNGDTNGSIVVTAADGISPYEYSINGGAFQTSNTFTGLAPAVYDIQVRDSKSCTSAITQVTIEEPTVVSGTVSATMLTCGVDNATQSATITVTGNGGTAPYTYSFDNGTNFTTNATFTTNTAGNVNIVVRDVNGCLSAVITETIAPLDPPTDLDFSATAVTCTATTSAVTLTATGGVGTLSYVILAPASATGNTTGATSGVFTGLTPETYLFEVTDANSCTYEEAFTVDPVTNITVSGQLTNGLTCNGSSDGALNFTVGDFTGTYSYTITGVTPIGPITGQTALTIPLTGLPAGNQTITVTDDTTGCTATASIVVPEPTPVTVGVVELEPANCNEGAFIRVNAAGGTPGYTFAFVVSGSPAPAAADYSASATTFLDTTLSANWDVYARDINGCTGFRLIRTTTDPLPTITLPTFAVNQCNTTGDDYTFSVATSTGQGTLEYALNNEGFTTNSTFTVSVPSVATVHTVTVRDENGCTAFDTITVYPPLSLGTTIVALPSCDEGDGAITVTGAGGSDTAANYSYVITAPASATGNVTGATTGMFTGLDSGNYTFEVTDVITTCTNQATIVLDAATPVIIDAIPLPVSCNGIEDGSITVNLEALPSNDNPIYQYEITSGIPTQGRPTFTRSQQTSNIFENLPAGEYTIQVTSGRGCRGVQVVTVTEPTQLTVSVLPPADFTCASDNSIRNTTITINVGTGTGTAPYTYSIDGTNFFATNTFEVSDTGSIQNITVHVRDANGCEETDMVTINPLPTITAAPISIATPIDCNGTGTVAIAVTGGSGNFSYELLGTAAVTQASNTFPITEPGTYFFRVNDLDTGCFFNTNITIPPFDTGDVVLTATNDVTCFNDGLGTFTLNVTGYTGAYTYEVFDSNSTSIRGPIGANTNVNPITLTGFSGGTYSVEIVQTDSPFCTTTSNVVTIDSPAEELTLSLRETANVTCDNNSGVITAEATGGEGPYEYQLVNRTTSIILEPFRANGTFTGLSDIVALPALDYSVTVRDARGCEVTQDIGLEEPMPITATIVGTPLLDCFNDTDGTVEITVISGGQGSNYIYTLNRIAPVGTSSGPQTSPAFNNLSAGTYNVSITDGYNCTFTTTNVTINEPDQVGTTLVLETSETCTVGASLSLMAFGGTPPYQYTRIMLVDTDNDIATPDEEIASAPTGTITTDGGTVSIPVTAGDYLFQITDANSCVSILSNQVTLPVFPVLTVNIDARNATILCTGDTTGVIVAEAIGGLGNYMYTLEEVNASNVFIREVSQNNQGRFTNLPAGNYRVRVNSGDCLETSGVQSIQEPPMGLSAIADTERVICAGQNNGSVEIIATGGTGTIKYAISPQLNQFFDEPIFENLAPGTYQFVAQDENGCFVTDEFDIETPDPIGLIVVDNSIVPELCAGDANGAFDVLISGGVSPYRVSVDSDADSDFVQGIAGQTAFNFANLTGGDHIVYVRDANDCDVDFEIDFPLAINLSAELVVSYGCNENISTNTVVVNLDDISLSPADVTYALDGGPEQQSNTFFNVAPGLDHFIEVRHINGCVLRAISNATLEPTFDIDEIAPITLTLEEGRINEIIANAAGGTGDYEFTFNDESTGSENSFFIFETGVYTVVVTDANGCSATASIPLEFIDICIPNVFIPGNQEGFGPGCADQYENLELDIFDRYGRKIASIDVNTTWDGTYNGKELPSGDYWYIVKLNDERNDREFVGHFTLYR